MSLLALDGGQTGTKGRIVGDGARSLSLSAVRTDQPLVPQFERMIREAAAFVPLSEVAIGTTGLTPDGDVAGRVLEAVRDAGVTRVLVAHDSVTSFLGALGDEPGAVVAAGTGVVTLAVGAQGMARVDGWGHVMGDAGSAYWIGECVLRHAMRAHDGRGPATVLLDAVRRQWADVESAYVALQGDPARVSIVAGFAHAATEAAGTDAVAAEICLAAADELALSVVTALRRADAGQSPAVRAIGGVFSSPFITTRFECTVRAAVPHVRFGAPRGAGLDGVVTLAGLRDDHPLQSAVSIATA